MNNKKKVLFVATVDIHIMSFHLPYLEMFKNEGWEVHVATNGEEKISFCDKKHKISFERSPFKINNLRAIRQMQRLLEKEYFDIVHCHTPVGAAVTRIAAKKARKNGTRVIYTAHGFHFYKGASILNWMLFYPVEKYLAKYTDTLITINKMDYRLARIKFNKRCGDIKYIPGVGIDLEKFKKETPKKDKGELRAKLGLRKDDFVLTCIARLDKNKNQEFLFDVMEKLIKKHNNIHLLLVGPDELNGYYMKKVDNKKLDTNIHFLGRREDIPILLAITDVVVSASLREGLPVNVLEAFAAGKPVVALNCRGMSDLVTSDSLGYIIDNNDVDLFCDAVLKIYKEGFNSRGLVKRAKLLSIDNILDMMKIVYFGTTELNSVLRNGGQLHNGKA